jgi:NAD(P)-dependent dehydrogenase (short-subunit alcohol dehydrogenase family)
MGKEMKSKVVVITGAAGGIGSAAAHAFAEQGAHLAMLDHNEEALQALSTQLRERGVHVKTIVVDLSIEHDVTQAIEEALACFGRINVLLSNVGVLLGGLFDEFTMNQWHTSFAVNLFAHVATIQAVLPCMKQQGSGTILITGSDQGLQPDTGLSAYAAAKAALHSLTKTLARELAPWAIHVNAIAPGMTRTPLVESLMQRYAHEFDTDARTAEQRELQRRGVPIGRLAEPDEVAQAMYFLATNTFLTGCIFDMSGGNVRGL